jgi:large subunit ribosomal protein L4
MKVRFLDSKGKLVNKTYKAKFLDVKANSDVLNKYIRAYLANQRQSNAHTKDRSEVSGGGKKPWRQKGTGRARHGSTRSPIWAGGGVTFGPRNIRNYKQKINKQEKKLAFATAMQLKEQEKTIFAADIPKLKKTQEAEKFLNKIKISGTLTIISNDSNTQKYFKNLKQVITKNPQDLNPFDLIQSKILLFNNEDLINLLKSKETK